MSEDETLSELVQENSGHVKKLLRIYQDFIFYFKIYYYFVCATKDPTDGKRFIYVEKSFPHHGRFDI